MRRRGRVDVNQAQVVEALTKAGASVLSLANIGAGVPDLMVGVRGQFVLIEVKDGAKKPSARKLTPAQVRFREWWRGPAPVTVTSVDEALALLRTPAHVCRQQHSVP